MPVTSPTSPDPGIVGPDPSGSLPPDPFAGMLGSMSAMGPDPYATSGPHMPPPMPPELVSDPSFPGGYAFETMDMMTGDRTRSPVDWGSLKSIGDSSPSEAGAGYGMGALMLGHGGEIWRNMSDSMDPTWHAVGSLYDTSVWSDPDLTGGSMAASLPAYAAPATSPFGSGGMYGPDPMAAMMMTPFSMPPASSISMSAYAPPPSMAPPLAPAPVAAPVAPPLAATPPPPTTPIPTLAPAPAPAAPMATAAPLIPIKTGVPEELTTIAPKPTDTTPKLFIEKLRAARAKSFAGIGGYSRCDPITGKCSNYA
jgi:hypothetical protein